jgi:asparagine synthase (glutamine-hydrolysing)
MAMATSVEARVPYLDMQLVEFAMRLPTPWKVSNGTPKHIFRQAVGPLLPDGVVNRPKQGFCGSSANILHPRIMDKLVADLRSSALLREILRGEAVEQLVAPGNRKAHSFKLWNLWNLALWHKHWFE